MQACVSSTESMKVTHTECHKLAIKDSKKVNVQLLALTILAFTFYLSFLFHGFSSTCLNSCIYSEHSLLYVQNSTHLQKTWFEVDGIIHVQHPVSSRLSYALETPAFPWQTKGNRDVKAVSSACCDCSHPMQSGSAPQPLGPP